jgi:hypothetical protein
MLEGTTAVWVRELVTLAHFLGAVLAFGAVLTTDAINGFMKVNPRLAPASARVALVTSMLIWLGLLVLSLTGILLLLDQPSLAREWTFQVKMGLVLLVYVNGIVLNEWVSPRFEELASEWAEQTERVQRFTRIAGVSAAVSLVGWTGAVVLGWLP